MHCLLLSCVDPGVTHVARGKHLLSPRGLQHEGAPPQQVQKRPSTVLCWCRLLAIMTQLSLDEVKQTYRKRRPKMNCELHTNVKKNKHAGSGTNTVDSCTDQKKQLRVHLLGNLLGSAAAELGARLHHIRSHCDFYAISDSSCGSLLNHYWTGIRSSG